MHMPLVAFIRIKNVRKRVSHGRFAFETCAQREMRSTVGLAADEVTYECNPFYVVRRPRAVCRRPKRSRARFEPFTVDHRPLDTPEDR